MVRPEVTCEVPASPWWRGSSQAQAGAGVGYLDIRLEGWAPWPPLLTPQRRSGLRLDVFRSSVLESGISPSAKSTF